MYRDRNAGQKNIDIIIEIVKKICEIIYHLRRLKKRGGRIFLVCNSLLNEWDSDEWTNSLEKVVEGEFQGLILDEKYRDKPKNKIISTGRNISDHISKIKSYRDFIQTYNRLVDIDF